MNNDLKKREYIVLVLLRPFHYNTQMTSWSSSVNATLVINVNHSICVNITQNITLYRRARLSIIRERIRTNEQGYISNEHREFACHILKRVQANNDKKMPCKSMPYISTQCHLVKMIVL